MKLTVAHIDNLVWGEHLKFIKFFLHRRLLRGWFGNISSEKGNICSKKQEKFRLQKVTGSYAKNIHQRLCLLF